MSNDATPEPRRMRDAHIEHFMKSWQELGR